MELTMPDSQSADDARYESFEHWRSSVWIVSFSTFEYSSISAAFVCSCAVLLATFLNSRKLVLIRAERSSLTQVSINEFLVCRKSHTRRDISIFCFDTNGFPPLPQVPEGLLAGIASGKIHCRPYFPRRKVCLRPMMIESLQETLRFTLDKLNGLLRVSARSWCPRARWNLIPCRLAVILAIRVCKVHQHPRRIS